MVNIHRVLNSFEDFYCLSFKSETRVATFVWVIVAKSSSNVGSNKSVAYLPLWQWVPTAAWNWNCIYLKASSQEIKNSSNFVENKWKPTYFVKIKTLEVNYWPLHFGEVVISYRCILPELVYLVSLHQTIVNFFFVSNLYDVIRHGKHREGVSASFIGTFYVVLSLLLSEIRFAGVQNPDMAKKSFFHLMLFYPFLKSINIWWVSI